MSTGIVLKSELAHALSTKYGMEVNSLLEVLSNTLIPGKKATKEQVVTLMVVAQQFDLNPFMGEIRAFPNKSGGISPMVGIEGWSAIVNRHPMFDGCDMNEIFDDKGKIYAVECVMYRKDRSHPIKVTEYYGECYRNTEPWNKWPIRMTRIKAYIQCARMTFSLSGIYDMDEIERMKDIGLIERVAHEEFAGIKRVDLDALPEASLNEAAQQQASLGQEPEKKRQRGRPRKVEASPAPVEIVTSPVVETHQEPSVPFNPDADDPTDTPEYLQGIQQPQG